MAEAIGLIPGSGGLEMTEELYSFMDNVLNHQQRPGEWLPPPGVECNCLWPPGPALPCGHCAGLGGPAAGLLIPGPFG